MSNFRHFAFKNCELEHKQNLMFVMVSNDARAKINSRIVWLTLFAGSIGFCCLLLSQTYQKYRDAPVLLSFDSQIHEIQSVGDQTLYCVCLLKISDTISCDNYFTRTDNAGEVLSILGLHSFRSYDGLFDGNWFVSLLQRNGHRQVRDTFLGFYFLAIRIFKILRTGNDLLRRRCRFHGNLLRLARHGRKNSEWIGCGALFGAPFIVEFGTTASVFSSPYKLWFFIQLQSSCERKNVQRVVSVKATTNRLLILFLQDFFGLSIRQKSFHNKAT